MSAIGAVAGVAMAATISAYAASSNVSHSYSTQTALPVGSLVSLQSHNSDAVQAANTANATSFLGVAVDSNDSLLAVNPATSTTKVQVATVGSAVAFVSTVNGSISTGDQIAVSPFNGIGMKAGKTGERVVGLALSGLDPGADTSSLQTVKDTTGASHQITVGLIRLNIIPGVVATASAEESASGLQRAVLSVTGKLISTPRIIVALVIMVSSLLGIAVLIYGAIYGTIISIGRNPLARGIIFQSFFGVFSLTVIMGAVATILVVLLLT